MRRHLEASTTLTSAIICITVCSLFAYRVCVIVDIQRDILCFHNEVNCIAKTKVVIVGVGALLHVINSSVNILIYSFFVLRFRGELNKKLKSCVATLRQGVNASESDSRPSLNTLSTVQSTGENIVHDAQRDVSVV
ncbi:hypothetical protein BaRGS_00030446 [Batillaria attramentaria]|uniref:G-protein coupled receptors family 1 profile domain-containing protein n=1 Tax=Batillaria attramentaria TaxID=370345 RepID=A0ABD0JTB1_9CAEN